MNKPIYIVIHCSATREDRDFTEGQINESHVAREMGLSLLYQEGWPGGKDAGGE
jgi:hypothetical protein